MLPPYGEQIVLRGTQVAKSFPPMHSLISGYLDLWSPRTVFLLPNFAPLVANPYSASASPTKLLSGLWLPHKYLLSRPIVPVYDLASRKVKSIWLNSLERQLRNVLPAFEYKARVLIGASISCGQNLRKTARFMAFCSMIEELKGNRRLTLGTLGESKHTPWEHVIELSVIIVVSMRYIESQIPELPGTVLSSSPQIADYPIDLEEGWILNDWTSHLKNEHFA